MKSTDNVVFSKPYDVIPKEEWEEEFERASGRHWGDADDVPVEQVIKNHRALRILKENNLLYLSDLIGKDAEYFQSFPELGTVTAYTILGEVRNYYNHLMDTLYNGKG